jgi:hypothetical protein
MARGHQSNTRVKIRTLEALWSTKPELVEAEVTRLKEEEGRTSPVFQLRTTASKNVLRKMSQQERRDLEEARKDMAKNGFSEEYKRM